LDQAVLAAEFDKLGPSEVHEILVFRNQLDPSRRALIPSAFQAAVTVVAFPQRLAAALCSELAFEMLHCAQHILRQLDGVVCCHSCKFLHSGTRLYSSMARLRSSSDSETSAAISAASTKHRAAVSAYSHH